MQHAPRIRNENKAWHCSGGARCTRRPNRSVNPLDNKCGCSGPDCAIDLKMRNLAYASHIRPGENIFYIYLYLFIYHGHVGHWGLHGQSSSLVILIMIDIFNHAQSFSHPHVKIFSYHQHMNKWTNSHFAVTLIELLIRRQSYI